MHTDLLYTGISIIKVSLDVRDNTPLAHQIKNLTWPDAIDFWNKKRQLTYKLGRTALFAFLEKYYKIDLNLHLNNDLAISYNEHGKPYFKSKEIYFNISHTDDYLFIIIAPYPTGIDVESIKARKGYQALKEKILTQEERDFLNEVYPNSCANPLAVSDEELERFFYLWTLKETLVKVTGKGLTGLNDFTYLPCSHKALHNDLKGVVCTYALPKKAVLSFYLENLAQLKEVNFYSYDYHNDIFTKADFLGKKEPDFILKVDKS